MRTLVGDRLAVIEAILRYLVFFSFSVSMANFIICVYASYNLLSIYIVMT